MVMTDLLVWVNLAFRHHGDQQFAVGRDSWNLLLRFERAFVGERVIAKREPSVRRPVVENAFRWLPLFLIEEPSLTRGGASGVTSEDVSSSRPNRLSLLSCEPANPKSMRNLPVRSTGRKFLCRGLLSAHEEDNVTAIRLRNGRRSAGLIARQTLVQSPRESHVSSCSRNLPYCTHSYARLGNTRTMTD